MSKDLKVLVSSIKMAIATFCSRILGLVREQVLAFYFGASGYTDAFLIAYRIPNLLRDLFAEGAFSAAFVPTFIDAQESGKEEARKLFWKLFILLGIITLTISAVTIYFAPEIINLFAPTFKEDLEKFELTVLLTRIMAPFLYFVSIAALFMGVLNSLKVFFIPSFAPVFFNISMILSMLIFPSMLIARGLNPILCLGIGVIIGGFIQAAVQFPMIIKQGYGPTRPGKLFSKRSKKVFLLLGPGLLGFAATQINLLVTTILASGTIIGAVSWLSFAFRLFQLPVGILSVSIGNSNLVHFSKAWKAGKKDEARETMASSYFISCFVVLPAMAALLCLNEEMINVIFERGKFTPYSTMMTSKALKWYAIGLPFYSIYKIFVPSFYAIDRQKIPVITSVLTVGLNIVFCIYMTPIYGFEVLALGTSLSMFINASILAFILRRDIDLSWSTYFNLRLLKAVMAFATSVALVLFVKDFIDFNQFNFINRCFILTGYLVIIALSYFTVAAILGERAAVKQILNKFLKRK
jgi:putative peptidoglycan lipid II flippase